ncbi:hypothetical protein N5923_23560 [Erwiniaceae bacterium BAC15a-03b]|uniref:Uncharacterized protein n=2 Tax=Winslowiella arboricola TaxID=2978220 RepID=A0A9J6PSN0_9GAMM|nr:hypothetical protein [Winslowiella arboricola]
MEAQKQEVLAGVVAAWSAAKRGEQHDRLNQMKIKTKRKRTSLLALESSFWPKQPKIIVTDPAEIREVYSDYTDRRFGLGGAARQE